MRGLFRHEITRKFPVIVAEQDDFRKYRAKRIKYPRKRDRLTCLRSFHWIYTDISVVFS